MTTIACDLWCMAADSMLSGDGVSGRVQKVWRVHDKDGVSSLVGTAGIYTHCRKFVNWYTGLSTEEPDWDAVVALSLSNPVDPYIQVYESSAPYRIEDLCTAIGSGAQGAICLMLAGYGPGKAIQIVKKVDPGTGGRVTTLRLKPYKKRGKRCSSGRTSD